MKLKKDFLQRLEEEKRAEEIEEEEKLSQSPEEGDEDSSRMHDEGDDSQMSNFQLDQIAYMLSQCIIFCQMPMWETYKFKFFSIILCTIANMKEDKD
jgi:hypothetical protein